MLLHRTPVLSGLMGMTICMQNKSKHVNDRLICGNLTMLFHLHWMRRWSWMMER